jgi:DNA-binding response OmpR family regulator
LTGCARRVKPDSEKRGLNPYLTKPFAFAELLVRRPLTGKRIEQGRDHPDR